MNHIEEFICLIKKLLKISKRNIIGFQRSLIQAKNILRENVFLLRIMSSNENDSKRKRQK
jgi:hypothetical protein